MKRLTDTQKQVIIENVNKLKGQGMSHAKACKAVKISPVTVYSWTKKTMKKPKIIKQETDTDLQLVNDSFVVAQILNDNPRLKQAMKIILGL